MKAVGHVVRDAFKLRGPAHRKDTRLPSAVYHPTIGAEPKLIAVREMLTVYRDVYLANPRLRGEKLLDAAHRHYLGRRNKRWAKVPMALHLDNDGGKIRPMRNLRRYIQKAENVMLNVARARVSRNILTISCFSFRDCPGPGCPGKSTQKSGSLQPLRDRAIRS